MRKVARGPALVVVGMLLLQAAWILTVPPFRGSDEFDHAYRAAAVAGGEWVAGEPVGDDDGWAVEVPGSLVAAAEAQCDELPGVGEVRCSPIERATDGNVVVGSTAAGYHPAFYWLVGSAAGPFEGVGALYAMRVATALLCLLFIGCAAWATSLLPGRWPMASLLLAATPVLIYSTTIVAPNGPEMAVGLSLWSALLAFCEVESERQQRRLLWVAIASAVLLGTLRLLGPLFILLIVGTVAALRWARLQEAVRRHYQVVAAGALLVGASVAQFAWWTFGPLMLDGSKNEADGSSEFSLGNLLVWPLQSIAAFPYRNSMAYPLIYGIVGALVISLLIYAARCGTNRQRTVLFVAFAATLALPVLLTVVTMGDRGVIWQGRYGLPYGVGFVLLAGVIIGSRERDSLAWGVTAPTMLACGIGIAACLIKVRQDELADNMASALDASWLAPAPWLLVLLSLAAMGAFGLAVSKRSHEQA